MCKRNVPSAIDGAFGREEIDVLAPGPTGRIDDEHVSDWCGSREEQDSGEREWMPVVLHGSGGCEELRVRREA